MGRVKGRWWSGSGIEGPGTHDCFKEEGIVYARANRSINGVSFGGPIM
jgi:uncharacterized protein YodC (DUF2158 family)